MAGFKKLSILVISCFCTSAVFAQMQNPKNIEFDWRTDTTKRNIDLSDLQVVLPKGSFPIIDFPKFIGKKEGTKTFFKQEPVIAVAIDGVAKAYPLNMLTMHEMANDTLGGIPILPTYCPLCNASIVYDRRLTFDGQELLLEFDVSGMLRNSDMVMFDRQTDSWWQQLTGEAMVGYLAGAELTVIPSLVISVEAFFDRYPEGEILSPKTGTRSESRYGINPYKGYDDKANSPYARFFDQERVDSRLPAMERVVDVRSDSSYKIYPFAALKKAGVINDQFKNKNLVLFYKKGTVSVLDKAEIAQSKNIGAAVVFDATIDDQILEFEKAGAQFTDRQTKSKWDFTGRCISGVLKDRQLVIEPHSNHFAFAWLVFHPESEIYEWK